MTAGQFEKMLNELKREFEKMFKSRSFDGVVDTLLRYHPSGKQADTDAQILVAGEFVRSYKERGELIPICSLSVSRDLTGRYAGVGFGVIPRLRGTTMKIKVTRRKQ